MVRKKKVENKLREEIRESLLWQAEQKDRLEDAYYMDLIEDYLRLWDIKNELIADIAERGVQVKYQNGANQWGHKKNDSVTEVAKYNAQMLKLINELGLKESAAPPRLKDDEEISL